MKDFYGNDREFEVGKLVIATIGLTPWLTKHASFPIEATNEFGQVRVNNTWVDSRHFLYHPYTVTVPDDAPVIKSIDELMHEIAYSWDYAYYPQTLIRAEDGLFHVNKLTIGPDWTEYKGNYSKLLPQLYEALCEIYEVIERARKQFGQPKNWDGSEVEE